MKQKPQFGPWALITGANSGIGAAFASMLASQGYNLVLVGRRKEAVQRTADKIAQEYSIETRAVIVDLSSANFMKQISKQTKDLDIGLLVSNAGDDAMGALLRVKLSDLKRMLQLNTASHLELVHHFSQRPLAKNKPYVIAGVMNRIMYTVGTLLGKTGGRNMWGNLMQSIVPCELKVRP